MTHDPILQVAIIGAGPAGLFASQKLASLGFGVALFNRDIKPGGLVEYGIYPDKHKLKEGFRGQFRQILEDEKVCYFGNVLVGSHGVIGINDLKEWGFSAVLVTCGAQGTKLINLPGEGLNGVYHAKDLVYHYNQLPPYSLRDFPTGKRAAVIGGGNVMTDIVHYLLDHRSVEEISVIVRRGPAEVKFDQKELLPIIAYLDLEDFRKEIGQAAPVMQSIGQNPEKAEHRILVALENACEVKSKAKIQIRFMQSPREILADGDGKVRAIKLERNILTISEGEVIAKGSGEISTLDVDTVIFAIGDKVNDDLGLPMAGGGICKALHAAHPVEGITYEVGDPQTGNPLSGVFHAGWSRNPSNGLAGVARRDGVFAASAIGEFLHQADKAGGIRTADLTQRIKSLNVNYVSFEHIQKLEEEEKRQAIARGLTEFKFDNNDQMLAVMGI